MILIGGFLGAGKTTLIGHFSRWLDQQKLRVGLVTNDRGDGLMDTDSARRANTVGGVEEITGGCFCCRLDDLVGAVGRLEADSRPDVIVAEPVGSCTDLMATVILPLEQVYRMPFVLSPLSVVLDARRALATLGGNRSARDFHRDVGYVFRKQIEEAEWLVVNKVDLLEIPDLEDLQVRLARTYPGKSVFLVSGRSGEGLEEWFRALMGSKTGATEIIEVDYERYAVGEAMLGWVNSEARCLVREGPEEEFPWGEWLEDTGVRIANALEVAGCEVGHFKMSVETGGRRWRLHQVMSGEKPALHEDELSGEGGGWKKSELGNSRSEVDGRLLVNLRAEGLAEQLEAIVEAAFSSQDRVAVEFLHKAAFQPGKPQPTHRVAAVL
jgi:Ni2+-binding GTPase involved in maturation of urease and hydrogenase